MDMDCNWFVTSFTGGMKLKRIETVLTGNQAIYIRRKNKASK